MKGKTNWIVGAVVLVVMAVIINAYVGVITGGGTPSATDPANAELVAMGEAVYAEACAECHGANLEGQPDWRVRNADGTLPAPPHDASGHTWHHADQMLFDNVKLGGQAIAPAGFQSAMPAFEEILSDTEIWAVLSFIKSRWPKEIQSRHTRMSARK